jgi:hypothetical protein
VEYWLLAHLIGDYILQNDWMAKNKKTNTWACIAHVLTYMIPFIPLCWFGLSPFAWGLIGYQHYIQDRSNFVAWFMDKKGSKDFMNAPMGPWSIVLTDNILHISFMWIVFNCFK